MKKKSPSKTIQPKRRRNPIRLIQKCVNAVRKLEQKYGADEVSPEGRADAILIAAGVLRKREYLRAIWKRDGPKNPKERREALRVRKLPVTW
jgi:hypothetical protein